MHNYLMEKLLEETKKFGDVAGQNELVRWLS